MKNLSEYLTPNIRNLVTFVALFLILSVWADQAFSQVQPPDRKFLFLEDRTKKENEKARKEQLKQKRRQVREKSDKTIPFDINAANIDFDSSGNKVLADGGLIISYGASIVEAQRGTFDVNTREAELSGDVRVTELTTTISAESAKLNLDTGSGTVQNCKLAFEDGDYRISSDSLDRVDGSTFVFENPILSTCRCPEEVEKLPWTLKGNKAEVTPDGYGHVWDATLNFYDVPVFYMPYLLFPAKTDRQTGFLPARFSGGSEDGFGVQVPFYWAIDEFSDATITGVLETETRNGVDTEYRRLFSKEHSLEGGLIYLNERPRDGDLRGIDVSGLNDTTIDEDRIGGYLSEYWRGNIGEQSFQFIVDGNYVSDDLFLREYSKDEIAAFNTRFVTSTAVLRMPLFTTYSADLSTEYNQAMVDDDDKIFQRLPELTLTGLEVFRPFGQNPLGLKLDLGSQLVATNFTRQEEYDGTRVDLNEKLKLPFYYKNYLDGFAQVDVRATKYKLDNREDFISTSSSDEEEEDEEIDVTGIEILEKDTDRVVPGANLRVGTVLERVYTVEEDSVWKSIFEYGRLGRRERLARMKHTLEPVLKYRFVPFVDQSDTPQFDSNDRLAQRNVLSYGLVQRLYGRYEPRDEYLYGIEEATPELEDLGTLAPMGVLDPRYTFGFDRPEGGGFQRLRRGTKMEMARFSVGQSFDVLEDRKDRDEELDSLSDIALDFLMLPNEHFRIGTGADFSAEDQEFSSYNIGLQLVDKRGDELRTRLNFVEDAVRQLETSVQVSLHEQIKVGYYSRYDDLDQEFIDNRVGLRFFSSCQCWQFDVNFIDRLNPDKSEFSFTLTLIGLGEIGNKFLSTREEDTTGG